MGKAEGALNGYWSMWIFCNMLAWGVSLVGENGQRSESDMATASDDAVNSVVLSACRCSRVLFPAVAMPALAADYD